MLFFFSSRRRHTRYIGDWSSDVCSSDLAEKEIRRRRRNDAGGPRAREEELHRAAPLDAEIHRVLVHRSEERRVGKECRSRRAAPAEITVTAWIPQTDACISPTSG